jgi:glutathione S-transferase
MATRLHYFDIYGRGEAIRFLLAHAKVEYEDVLVSREQLAEYKTNGLAEFGQLPILERDGKRYVQSWSILRVLGQELGYYPSTDAEAAYQVDVVVEGVEEFFTKYFRPIFEQDADKKAALVQDLLAYVPRMSALVNAKLAANSSQTHIVGDKRTIADLALAVVAFNAIENPAGPFREQLAEVAKEGEFPLVDAYFAQLGAELGERLSSRQPRPF